MTKEAAKTGMGPTFLIAVEQSFPEDQRIITDKMAGPILPLTYRIMVRLFSIKFFRHWLISTSETSTPGLWSGLMLRKLYINEKLDENRAKIEEIVNLGAGYDTRSFTLPSISTTPIWELDQPQIMDPKKKRVISIEGSVPDHVKLIATDFDHDDINQTLKNNGYSIDKPTFFILEAVTQYLDEDSVRKMFKFLSNAQTGSRIVFTYVLQGFIEGVETYGMGDLYKKYVFPKIWKFGMYTEDCQEFLDEYGWKIIEDVGADDIYDKYITSNKRDLATTKIERIIYAEKI